MEFFYKKVKEILFIILNKQKLVLEKYNFKVLEEEKVLSWLKI